MRNVVFLTVFLAMTIISISTAVEVDTLQEDIPMNAVYRDDASPYFLFDRNSSFYDTFSVRNNPPLLFRKVGHFMLYGLLAAILFLFIPTKRLLIKSFLAILLAGTIGLIDEVHQYFLVSRGGRILDVYINLLGIVSAVSALVFFIGIIKLRRFLFAATSKWRRNVS
ncbi:VanZ family protein [Evansella cellulosilytica]|uniref:VanZ-like domain-containing protein n=1 Tax=Evansella cellulosilytica (strain ATCC 21833 / DSM 2522 / FERM P-1141 / JCM 9156 / N-4) TaxID=649639 RepID=E6TT16_EVAC2|nr:VanZ family protein [Evansella cellulosilytica]ADU31924.1 hypothetical protein Bcell_3683 [Evansella cellulosilytica DSM 2522]